MWFTWYFVLATSTYCVALGFVPNQLPSAIHKLGLKPPPPRLIPPPIIPPPFIPPPLILDISDESEDIVIKQQSSSTVRSGLSNISFDTGFDDVGYSKQSFSTKTSSTSIQIDGDSEESDSFREFVEDIGDDVMLSSTNVSTSSLTQSMSDLDILSGRSMDEGNLQESILIDNSEIISDIISSGVDEDITISTVSDQINVTAMEDIIEEMTETTDTMTLSEIEDNLEASNLINNGPILPMYNTPTLTGPPSDMGDLLPPSMMKLNTPGSMMSSITPSQSIMNYLPDHIPPTMPKPHQPYPSFTPSMKMPPVKPHRLHPTDYIPSPIEINSLPKPKTLPPGKGNQYNKLIPHLPEIPATLPYKMPTSPLKKPYIPHQLPSVSSLTSPMKKPFASYPLLPTSTSTSSMKKPYGANFSPPLMPTQLPKHNRSPYGRYPSKPRENPFLPSQMLKPQMPHLPTTLDTLTDSEYFIETSSQMNDFKPTLPWQYNYSIVPGMNMPGMNMPGMNMPGMNMPGMNMPGMNMPGMNMPGINMPGMNMPGMNMPGINAPPYILKYPFDMFNEFDETSDFFDTTNYGSLNKPYMNSPMDFPYSQMNILDSNYGLKYPYSPQPKKYPVSMKTNLYPFERQEYPFVTPRNSYPSINTGSWPYFRAPQHLPYKKPLHAPTSGYPYLLSGMSNSPYSSIPKPKIPIPMNQPRNSSREVDLLPSQFPHPSIAPSNYPKPLHLPKLPSGITPSSYPQPLHPPKLPPRMTSGNYPPPLYQPKLPSGITPSSYPQPPYQPKLLPRMTTGNHPPPPYPPKLPPSGIIPGNYPKPLHPLKFPPVNTGDYLHPTYPPSSIYPQDISYLIDQHPELYSYFDAVIYSSAATLIAAKELSDAGKLVLLISGGSYPPPESRSLYLRPQILVQPNYMKRGPINIPGAFSPKQYFYPTFFGGHPLVGPNNWDYGTIQKNQQWGHVSPAWNWSNIAKLYESIELIPGEIDAEGIIPVDRSLPRTQTIEYISSALQDLGLIDLGTEYSLRDRPGSMMLPIMAEESPAGLEAVVFTEEVLEDMNNPENVFLCLNTEIENINIMGNKAMGVTIKTPSGQKHSINAQDVIIGASPGRITQLLYKSGLGDETVLDQLQIPTQQHLPAVGKYWSVKPMFTGSLFTFPQGTLKEFGTSDKEAKEDFLKDQYIIQSGILLEQFKAFVSIQDGLESNVTINFYAFTEYMVERLNALMEGLFQFDEATQMYIRDLLLTNDVLFAMPQLMDVKSQGEIVINNQSDLNFPPNLNSGMYTNPQDMLIMQGALQFVESLGETPTFQMLGANYMQISVDACMGYRSFERYTECAIRNLSVPGFYSNGGAIMGTNSFNSVVNENLQVHGMENLYIMSTAIIPNGAGAESVATDSLIGQYGANFILRKENLYL